jgi:hypothetical protein
MTNRASISNQTPSTPPFGISKIRERAGSVLSLRSKRERTNTNATKSSVEDGTSTPKSGRFRERERDLAEGDEGDREGMGSSFGTGQLLAPPEIPRV